MHSWIWPLLVCVLITASGCDDATLEEFDAAPADVGQADVGDTLNDAAMDAAMDASSRVDAAPVDAAPVDAAPVDAAPVDGAVIEPTSAERFLEYARPELIPGRFRASPCAAIDAHHECVSTAGCGWLRTIKDGGVCRADPVARCLDAGECVCRAHDFHGDPAREAELALFLPLSITARNLAPRTSTVGGESDRFEVSVEMEPVIDEARENFTSRTDFTARRLDVRGAAADARSIADGGGVTLTAKFMRVWDQSPAGMSGVLLDGLGVRLLLEDDRLSVETADGERHAVAGEHPVTGGAKDYQCNQMALVVPAEGDATIWLGAVSTPIPGLDLDSVRVALANADAPVRVLSVGPASAKIWDVRLYDQGPLSADELAEIGKRCGGAGTYPIPAGYPESNQRYSWGMGGMSVVPHHAEGHFSSGVYVTLRIPEDEVLPYMSAADRDNLNRMIGYWDRWHEQMYFEMDLVPFVDTRTLPPAGSLNSYRSYPEPICRGGDCGEKANFDNPCRYATDLFQAINWLPEDWPDEPTSADHRRVAEAGGWTRWDAYDPNDYQRWQRPVHEHGHTAHFTLMRTYEKVHHYLRGLAGEAFAEVMTQYVLAGVAPWMLQGLTYYPSVPLALEGRWDGERHVLQSAQPYQSRNIGDQGLGARFYGMGLWWTFASHFAGKPYLIGRISGDNDVTPGTVLQKTRFYLAQERLDLGDLYGNFVAHTVTWDWPRIGHFLHAVEQDTFGGIERWCTENSGPDCTIDTLKIHADVSPDVGTDGAWIEGPAERRPGGFASNTIRIAGAPGGALYAVSLAFDVPEMLFEGTDYHIGLRSQCRADPRFFSSRIVVAEAGTEGQADRPRPQYYKIPGRAVDDVIIQVPEGADANVYVLPIPTPPFELEEVHPFVESGSVTWAYRYRITRLDAVPADAEIMPPITLAGDATLALEAWDGAGFSFDCFAKP